RRLAKNRVRRHGSNRDDETHRPARRRDRSAARHFAGFVHNRGENAAGLTGRATSSPDDEQLVNRVAWRHPLDAPVVQSASRSTQPICGGMGALAVFGFELQTNANLFMSGVKERQVAWRGDNVTLEGDETTDNPDKSELEFVTAPCVDRATALRAMASARKLAAQLRVDAGLVHGNLTFAAGQAYAGGVWERACTVRIGNFPFAAAPQVTVGVPLARMREFVTAVLHNLGDTRTVEDLAGMATQAKQVMTHFHVPDSAE